MQDMARINNITSVTYGLVHLDLGILLFIQFLLFHTRARTSVVDGVEG